jgi:hypothetical protein
VRCSRVTQLFIKDFGPVDHALVELIEPTLDERGGRVDLLDNLDIMFL